MGSCDAPLNCYRCGRYLGCAEDGSDPDCYCSENDEPEQEAEQVFHKVSKGRYKGWWVPIQALEETEAIGE